MKCIYLACIFLALNIGVVSDALSAEVWFSPPDNLFRFGKQMNEDFSQLFAKADAWSSVSGMIAVFGLNAFYAAKGPDSETKSINEFLASRGISLNVALDALPSEGCGDGVEGMIRSADQPGAVAARLRKMGISVGYFAFDEPLTFGHLYDGKNACRYTIKEVAERLSRTVSAIRRSYPNAKFVDYEVPNGSNVDRNRWRSTLATWLRAYSMSTGRQLDVLVLDVQWHLPWKEVLADTVRTLHSHGIRAGVFVNAEAGAETNDNSWIADAKSNAAALQKIQPPIDIMLFATWNLHPWKMLPESDPTSFASVIRWYGENFGYEK